MFNFYYDPLNSVIIQYSSSNSQFHYYNVIASTEIWSSLKDKTYALTDVEYRYLISRGELIKINTSSVRDLFTYFTKCIWKEIDPKFKTIFKNFNKLKIMSTNYYFPKSKCFAFRDYWTHCFEHTVTEEKFIEILFKEAANLVTEDFICSNLDLDYPEFVKNKFILFRIKDLIEKYIDCYVLLYSKKRNSFSIYTVDKSLYITRVYQ